MSYGLFNWWWGEDTEDSDWSWLINHLSHTINDVSPNPSLQYEALMMKNIFTVVQNNEMIETDLGWLDFRFLPLKMTRYDVDTVEGITNIANWMEANIALPKSDTQTAYGIKNDTITAFLQALKTHRPFYRENIKGGEPFVWIPKTPTGAQELWWGVDDVEGRIQNYAEFKNKIDRLMVDIGEGYICINPEANRAIAHFVSDNWTAEFETVADTVDWDYPQWYFEVSEDKEWDY